jgi:hypothetical protein
VGEVIDLNVRQLAALPEPIQQQLFGFRRGVEFVGSDNVKLPEPLDWYFLGLWLGGGSARERKISGSQDEPEIENYLPTLCRFDRPALRAQADARVSRRRVAPCDRLLTRRTAIGCVARCRISASSPPRSTFPRWCSVRVCSTGREVFAGLMDSAGWCSGGRGWRLVLWRERGDEGVVRLAQTLGLANSLVGGCLPAKKAALKSTAMLGIEFRGPGQHLVPCKAARKQQLPYSSDEQLGFGIQVEPAGARRSSASSSTRPRATAATCSATAR